MSKFIVVHSFENPEEQVVINVEHIVRITTFQSGPRKGASIWLERAGAAYDDHVMTKETLKDVVAMLPRQ